MDDFEVDVRDAGDLLKVLKRIPDDARIITDIRSCVPGDVCDVCRAVYSADDNVLELFFMN